MIWVRYKGEIYILDFTFITDPTKSKIKYRGKNIEKNGYVTQYTQIVQAISMEPETYYGSSVGSHHSYISEKSLKRLLSN